MSGDEILTTREAAAYLKLHPDTLRDRAEAGLIPGIRVDRRWRFRRSALDAYLQAGERGSGLLPVATPRPGVGAVRDFAYSPEYDEARIRAELKRIVEGDDAPTVARRTRTSRLGEVHANADRPRGRGRPTPRGQSARATQTGARP
jgi:excisionase family DNA binding protein